jgi:hypothetical protein
MVDCEPIGGTDPADLFHGLSQIGELKVKKIFHVPRLEEIDKELDRGRAIILRYLHAYGGGHYALIIGRTKRYYILVNDSYTKTVKKRSRKTLIKMIREKAVYPGTHMFCVAWSVEPR